MTGRRDGVRRRAGVGLVVGSLAASIWTLALPVPAVAQSPPAEVSLAASPTTVIYGDATQLSGAITPPAGEEPVAVVDADTGEELATAVTASDGSFAVSYSPAHNLSVRAEWSGAASDPVALKVRPVLTGKIANVFLFAKARVTGRLRPAHEGAQVSVTLLRAGVAVLEKTGRLNAAGKFSLKFPIERPGRYRARIRFNDEDHLAVHRRTKAKKPPLPALSTGSRGKPVKFLERRLRALDYRILGLNRRLDFRTADAVLAFHKVQGMERVKSVSAATWRKLADPFVPAPRAKKPALHFEIDQTRQVLYVVRGGRIDEIVHTSTGRNNWTRDGVFRVHRKIAGYSPNRLYYPSYFDGYRAVHGWPEVPPYAASHGCARVPYWTAVWLHRLMDYDSVVRVYH